MNFRDSYQNLLTDAMLRANDYLRLGLQNIRATAGRSQLAPHHIHSDLPGND